MFTEAVSSPAVRQISGQRLGSTSSARLPRDMETRCRRWQSMQWPSDTLVPLPSAMLPGWMPMQEQLPGWMPMQEPLSLDALKNAATLFAADLSNMDIPELYGVTDGKAVGTYVEAAFNIYIARNYRHVPGNAARGIDFPGLDVDLKVTSIRQPQSSCPFRDALQKVYGLGYSLLVIVYDKHDMPATSTSRLDIRYVVFIDQQRTADYQLTRGLRSILATADVADESVVQDIDAYLEDKNIPLDPESRRQLAARISQDPPEEGFVTISNALQWRLQYGHAIRAAELGNQPGVENLRA